MPLTPGTRLGPYDIVAPLGAGGMGEVYRARDPRLGRDIAIKILPDGLAHDAKRLARFEREARTVAALTHPNIVTIYALEEAAGVRFLAMELVDGETFDTRIVAGGAPLASLFDLAIPLAQALAAAHERGIVHRDLKPMNIMVTRSGLVKVLDFGLAKLAEQPELDATQTAVAPISEIGGVVGTMPYMAPEQLRGDAVDARTDLFSFGVVLYELATGTRPFVGNSSADLTSAILRDTPPALGDLRGDLPGALCALIDSCLAKEGRYRPASALEVANTLRQIKRAAKAGELVAAPRPSARDAPSIAVLPFVNRSRDADDEYFSDGLADELLTVLGRIRGMRVAARTSSFAFKGKDATIADIGKALGVATILEGSVRKAGERVRIAVQLVKVADGYHLWSETYDRTLEDIFAVQDDIAQAVVKELRATLLGEMPDSNASGEVRAEVARAAKGRAHDPEAQRFFLQGRHIADGFRPEDLARAREYLRQALDIDPAYARAWAELSRTYARESDLGVRPVADAAVRARAAIDRALELEPDLAEAHATLGWIQFRYDWDWPAAEASYRRAAELTPDDTLVLRALGNLARAAGRSAEALEYHRRSLALDPLSAVAHAGCGWTQHEAGHLGDAEQYYRSALELSPHMEFVRTELVVLLTQAGRPDDALREALLGSHGPYRLEAEVVARDARGERELADQALAALIDGYGERNPYEVAAAYALRGDADNAFVWLERARVARNGFVTEARFAADLVRLHDDPRWEPFVAQLGVCSASVLPRDEA